MEQTLQSAATAKQKAEAEGKQTIDKAHEAAQQILTAAREAARQQTEQDVLNIMAEARQKAEQTIREAQSKAVEEQAKLTAQILGSIRSQAEAQAASIIEESRKQAFQMLCAATEFVHKELSESSLLLREAQERLERVNQEAAKYADPPAMPAASAVIATDIPPADATAVNTVAPPASTMVTREKVYKGIVKLSVLPPANFNQVDRLQKQIAQLPAVRVVGAGASEYGESWMHWIHVELVEPMPLLTMLSTIPQVKSVAEQDNTLALSLRPR